MAVTTHGGTMPGGVTPLCDTCGVSLCWDISRTEYLEARAFWDAWSCRDCSTRRLSAHGWRLTNGREALPTTIEGLIVAFQDADPGLLGDPFAQDPLTTAGDFVDLLSCAGVAAHVGVAGDVRGRPHHAVVVGDFTIDWCAARHDDDAPTPLAYRTSLGWPIEPESMEDLLKGLADMDPEDFRLLLSSAIDDRMDGAA